MSQNKPAHRGLWYDATLSKEYSGGFHMENKQLKERIEIMEICDDGHDQVCFDGRKCPVCAEMKKVSDMEDQIYDLEETIKELKG